jgi:7-cyano-7-deazaguanine tRNA-ribosyltransferase
MQYYISWTHSDLVYQQHLHDIGVLVSPPNVSLAWQVVDWPSLPHLLIIDSGAFQFHRQGRVPSAEQVLNRQLHILSGMASNIPVGICHLDIPMLGTRNIAELQQRVRTSLTNAQWLMNTVKEQGLPANVRPIGVIQGYSVESVYEAALVLEDMGYTWFALGSLAGMVAHSSDEMLRRVEASIEAVGTNIHVLGVSSVRVVPQLASLGVGSIDSGAPIREAWTGGVLYSLPFRRFKISNAYFKEWSRTYGFAELLTEPLPCDCPVCVEDSSLIMRQDGKRFVNLRSLHNCYHMARELAGNPFV